MFGFGFGKLIVLAAVVAAVWYGFKLVTRLDQERKRRHTLREKQRQGTESVGKMEKCAVCGTYVVAATAGDCGRDGCPY